MFCSRRCRYLSHYTCNSFCHDQFFLKATFPPEYPGSLPCYIFYDNNCNLLKSLRARKDHFFDNVGLPVDVFHALHKHNADDQYCQRHCNPAGFPDLMTKEGEWLFNSSVAEQVNRWFGGFQRLVREMAPARLVLFVFVSARFCLY